MLRSILIAGAALLMAAPAAAQVPPYPVDLPHAGDRHERRDHPCRSRRKGPVVVAAPRLRWDRRHVGADGRRSDARPHRHCARSARPRPCPPTRDGFDKKNSGGRRARRARRAEDRRQADFVTHDIGNMVGFAFAAAHRDRISRFVLIDAPVPGVGPWEEILKNPLLWHFRFGGPDMERLVAGPRAHLSRPLLE